MTTDPTAGGSLRDLLDAAAALVEDPAPRVRLAGLLDLVRLADEHAVLRRPVVTVLGAYLRRPLPDRSSAFGKAARREADRNAKAENDVRRAVLGAVRDHLLDPDAPTSWSALDIDLRDTVLSGDLSGVVVTGALRLDRVTVPCGGTLDLRGARVTGAVHLDRTRVCGRLDLTDLTVTGEVSLDRITVVSGGSVVLDRADLTDGAVWVRGAEVAGTLSLRGVAIGTGTLSLHDTQVRGGEIRLDGGRVDGGHLHVGAATVDGGGLRLDGLQVAAGMLSLALTSVRRGVLSLERVDVADGATVRLDGLATGADGVIVWGPFEPVAPPPAAEPAGARGIDLRGPAPADPWAWLEH